MKRGLLFSFFLINSLILNAQDTVFINKHHFDNPVKNVFRANDKIFVKSGKHIYQYSGEKWQKSKQVFEKPFVFYENGFVESSNIPQKFTFEPKPLRHLIPQTELSNPSCCFLGNKLFVSVGGSLFEYQIFPHYTRKLKSHSIREIFLEENLKVIVSYTGIFINDSLKVMDPYYANGSFVKIKDRYFLNNDCLYEFSPQTGFNKIAWKDDALYSKTGHFRHIVSFRGDMYGQFTHAIGKISSFDDFEVIHSGFEYLDIESVNDKLIFGTKTGEIFLFNGENTELITKLKQPVNDIYSLGNMIYFSSENGVYQMDLTKKKLPQKLLDLNHVIGIVSDARKNLWISTENGLYLWKNEFEKPVEFIPGVEFNREAIAINNDTLYLGSINGLYIVDIPQAIQNYLPLLELNTSQ